jgi:hypothetical protein
VTYKKYLYPVEDSLCFPDLAFIFLHKTNSSFVDTIMSRGHSSVHFLVHLIEHIHFILILFIETQGQQVVLHSVKGTIEVSSVSHVIQELLSETCGQMQQAPVCNPTHLCKCIHK